MKSKGFTLIELLIVVAILAIVGSVIVPHLPSFSDLMKLL